MRLPLNQPLSTFLLVLSILAILLGIALFESGHAWLFHNSPSPSIGLWFPGAVAVGYVVLRMILKRL
jgi:hypothetical protein